MGNRNDQNFKKIFTENFDVVGHVIRKFPSLRNDVDDISHEVFLNFHLRSKTTEIANPRAYLITAARNACLNAMDKKRTQKTEVKGEDIDRVESTLWPSDCEHEMNVVLVSGLIDEIAMEDAAGKCFKMFYKDGRSLKDISEATGEPVGTIAARIARLRERLKLVVRQRLGEAN